MKFDMMHPADQIVWFMNRVYRDGLTTTSGGNLSIKDKEGNIWISPSGIDKGTLTRHDIMCVKSDGTVIGPHTPSMELPFHSHVYQIRPDVHAVLHAHSPCLVSYSLARMIPNTKILPALHTVCGAPVMAPYAIPGSIKLGDNIAAKFAEGHNAVIMENHGACVAAPSMNQAYMLFETLEATAAIAMNAKRLGKAVSLTKKQLSSVEKAEKLKEFKVEDRTSEELAVRRDMIPFIVRCCDQGLFGSTRGVYSCRLSDGSFVITPSGKNMRFLDDDDLVLIKGTEELKREAGKMPSCMAEVHARIYAKHPDIGAIASSEPRFISSYAVTGAPLDSRTIPESYIQLMDIGRAPFTPLMDMPDAVESLISPRTRAVLVQNGPIIATGKNMTAAFDRLEVAEATAMSLISAMDAGPLVCMSDEEIKDIDSAFSLPS